MSSGDSLGDRMKGYERACRHVLPRRLPVILRVDGKAFHTYTRGLSEPFDSTFISAMNGCAETLCEAVQGTALAYVQSDEISLLVHGYRQLQSEPWFDNEIQKMASVAASVAGATMTMFSEDIFGHIKGAHFDARVFVLPEAEVANYFIWRQQDATRNSIQMSARAMFSHKECHEKNCSELQEMLFTKGQNWNDTPTPLKRGRCVLRQSYEREGATRHRWRVDNEIPIFTQDRAYIEKHLAIDSTPSPDGGR